jgi:hypothetical protein
VTQIPPAESKKVWTNCAYLGLFIGALTTMAIFQVNNKSNTIMLLIPNNVVVILLLLLHCLLMIDAKNPPPFCSHYGIASLKLNTVHPSLQRYQNLDVPLDFANGPFEAHVEFAESHLYAQFDEVCRASVGSSWTPQECSQDLKSQFLQYMYDHCENHEFQPNQIDECKLMKKLEVSSPMQPLQQQLSSPAWLEMVNMIKPARIQAMWNVYYEDVATFIRQHYYNSDYADSDKAPSLTIVEIGTMYGGLSNYLTGHLRNSHVYAVDPFIPNYDDVQQDDTGVKQGNWAELLKMTNEEFSVNMSLALAYMGKANHGCRFHQMRAFSKDAALSFEDNSVDVVFIDGLHTYEGAVTDIMAWKRKLKKHGGSFIFNDVALFAEVGRALDDFATGFDLEVIQGQYRWPPGYDNAAVIFK